MCCKADWISAAAQAELLEKLGGPATLASWSIHGYGLSQPRGGPSPPLWELMDGAVMEQRLEKYGIKAGAQAAANAGVQFVVGETNSINMGGAKGLSDTHAAALWAFDW